MKRLLVLLFIPLLVTGIFAASSGTPLSLGGLLSGASALVQESQAVQLQSQINLLEIFNAMKLTSTQASSIAKYLKDFKAEINALQDQRVKALTALRDALVSNDATAVRTARNDVLNLDSKYAKLTENLITEVKSTITVEQLTLLEQYFQKVALQMQRKILGPNARNEIGRILPNRNFNFSVNPQKMYYGMNFLQNIGRNVRAQILRSPDLIYTVVNLPFYDVLIQTLQLKAQ